MCHSPQHPLIRYEQDGAIYTITWAPAVQAFRAAARLVQNDIKTHASVGQPSSESPPIISILAVAGTSLRTGGGSLRLSSSSTARLFQTLLPIWP